jgi:hypothetical protein
LIVDTQQCKSFFAVAFPNVHGIILGFESSFWRTRKESTNDILPPALIYVKPSWSIPASENVEPGPTAESTKAACSSVNGRNLASP